MLPNARNQTEFLEPMLKDSIKQFLAQHRIGRTHFTDFDSLFTHILQDFRDPPLELVWFYSAVRFYSSRPAFHDDCVKLVVSFFQLLVSCSDSFTGAKKVAVLFPVLYRLSRLVITRRGAKRETLNLLEGIVSYISMHCVEESEDDDDVLMASGSCFADLTRVWVVEEVTENSTLEDCLEIFVPFVSEELRRGMGSESCGVGYLAGIVTFQVFLLSLCLNFDRGVGRSELEKDLKECMVQMISGFQSYHFFDIILKMLLLEPNLPVTSLLDPEDAVILHETLTEVVITSVENLFLQPENGTSQQSIRLKNIAINWLFLVENAMETARRNKDLEKSSCYMNMFSNSRVQTYLIDFVSNQGELMKDPATLRNSSPKGLIKCLLSVEKQGQKVFEFDHSRNSAKDVIQGSRAVLNLKTFKETQKNPDEKNPISNPFGADRKEKFNQDTEMDDTMELLNSSSTRKRKEERHREGQTAIKLLKHRHNLHENSKSKFQPFHLSESLVNKTEVDIADMEL